MGPLWYELAQHVSHHNSLISQSRVSPWEWRFHLSSTLLHRIAFLSSSFTQHRRHGRSWEFHSLLLGSCSLYSASSIDLQIQLNIHLLGLPKIGLHSRLFISPGASSDWGCNLPLERLQIDSFRAH
ncbi:unnamed protein product [Protopolystoma xenopodis]|uniref:Uncharacterized protein n=1 Tax=Protopolystoma xenopodis TaxID=117903 RepID=A0A448X1Z7_9PLAT|nr:unnamed protein product [Protopolystoma xenopodis]